MSAYQLTRYLLCYNPWHCSEKLDKSDKTSDKSYKSTINQLFSTIGFGSRGVESMVWFGTLKILWYVMHANVGSI